MPIKTSSIGNTPASIPLAGEVQTNALLLITSNQMQNVATDWAKITQLAITFDPPVAHDVSSPGILDSIPWPVQVTQVKVDGELQGSYWVLMQVRDAVSIVSGLIERPIPGPSEPVALDALAADAVHELFNIYVGASDRIMCKGADERVRLKQVWTKSLGSAAELAREGLGHSEGWMVEIRMKVGSHSFRFWQIMPRPLGADTVEYYRDELAGQISIVCGGRAEPPVKAGWRGKILVVDDAASIRAVIREYLETEGFQVIQAENGDHALRMLRTNPIKAVMLDILLPDMDGFEVCRRIRRTHEKSVLPVIFCTCRSAKEDVVQAIRAGASDYMMKPFSREILINKVMTALQAVERKEQTA